jgi:hypothetical protein
VTVEAGTFDVCEVNSGGQTVAVNPNVAFNIVRAKTTNGTFSLVSFLKK